MMMRINKNLVRIVLVLFSSFPFLVYLVNFRWGGGDANSYLVGSKIFFESFSLDPYSFSGALFSPFVALAGGNPDALMYSSLFYRIGFTCAFQRIEPRLLSISLISFAIFPLHTLLSLFPGKDVFSYGFFILLVYSMLQRKSIFVLFLFSSLSFLFRPPLGSFLLMACSSYAFYLSFLSKLRLSGLILLILSSSFALLLFVLLIYLFPDFSLANIQERISIELDANYFNVTGYVDLPWSALNLFFPLLSVNPVSFYSLLALENAVSLFFIFQFLRRPSNPFSGYFSFKLLCVFVVFYAVVFSAFWPNITDSARKIYPLTFCGAASCFLLRESRKLNV